MDPDPQYAARPAASPPSTLADRIRDRTAGTCRLITLRTPVENVVSWRGSFRAYPRFAEGEELLQSLAVSLLDKGTARRDRFAIAELLEDRGAQVHFDSEALFVECSGRALRDDVPEVLAVVAEQLREPLFDPAEFDKARARLVASLRRSLESTGTQAGGALARRLYRPAHPNFIETPEAQIARLEAFTVDDVRAYHAEHFGARDLTLALVGDIDEAAVETAVGDAFGDWPAHAAPPAFETSAAPEPPGRVEVPMPDKQNVDVRLGHPLRLVRQDPDYLPLYVANYVLGGNFSARLMTIIRDEMGLTYGIRSGLSGITSDYQGHWYVSVTLSQDNVDRGVEATLAEVRRFVDDGVRADELEDKKTTITGAFKVGLATTGGLASALLTNAERGFDVGYLDRFPAEIEAVTLEQANAAVRRHLDPDRLHVALAGMLSEPAAS